jgi:hypothetical protein
MLPQGILKRQVEVKMRISGYGRWAALVLMLCFAGARQAAAENHDFDFAVGTWKSEIKRLEKPLMGSTTWVPSEAKLRVQSLWQGDASLEELILDGANVHVDGITLRLYDPESKQWRIYWANRSDGTLGPPGVGGFKNGRGEFYDQEEFSGRMILVRQTYFDITRDSYRFEQAFSDDGGKTWEPNWIAKITRVPAADAATPEVAKEHNHDFDFNLGRLKTHVARLDKLLVKSQTWIEYDGSSEVLPLWNGAASLLVLEVSGPAGKIEGMGLRLFNPDTKQWSLNWASRKNGRMTTPMVGHFDAKNGEFFGAELLDGRAIFARNGFYEIAADSVRFEQAFSTDAGKTWETNWVMTFKREAASAAAKKKGDQQ